MPMSTRLTLRSQTSLNHCQCADRPQLHLLNDVLIAFQIMAKAFRVPYNDQESNDQFSNVGSYGNTPPTTLTSLAGC
jgi:hypothetical protein